MVDAAPRPVPSLSIVVPMLNEADGIVRAVAELAAEAEALLTSGQLTAFEIVLVDDGSSDATAAVVAGLADERAATVVVTHEQNRGLGAAVRTGIGRARNELILYTDADLPAPKGTMQGALDLATTPTRPVVSAHRLDRRPDGPRRLVYSAVYNTLVRFVFGLEVKDVNFAYKLFDRRTAEQLELRSEGSFIDAELLVAMRRSGQQIVQFPVEYRARLTGRSTLSRMSVVVDIVRELSAFGRRTGWRHS